MKDKIAYIAINSSYSHSSLVYGFLRAFVEEKIGECFEWIFFETGINDNFDCILQNLFDYKPDIILSTAYCFNIEYLQKLFDRIGILLPSTVCILGGPEFLGNNFDFLIRNKSISCVFRGDESSFPEFLTNYTDMLLWSKIEGICYLNDKGEYVDNGIAHYEGELDELTSPYEKGYFKKDKVFVHYETSRGCIAKCSFCTSALSEGIKTYSLSRIESDLKILYDAGVREIRILDRTFNLPEKRSIDLLNLFFSKFTEVKFHLEIDPSKLTLNIMKVLLRAPKGQLHLELGIQTFNEISLRLIKRKVDLQKLERNLKILINSESLLTHTDLIYGLPKQSYLDVLNDIKKLIAINPDEIQLEVLKILPGTPILDSFKDDIKYASLPPYEVLSSSYCSFELLLDLKILSRIIDSFYNVKGLKNLFRYAIIKDQDFISDFMKLYKELFTHKDKPSLAARIGMFFEYARLKKDFVLYGITTFCACFIGCFPEKLSNVEIIRKKSIPSEFANFQLLWQDARESSEKMVCSAIFDFNVGDVFFDAQSELVTNQHYHYIFYYHPIFGMNGKAVKILISRH